MTRDRSHRVGAERLEPDQLVRLEALERRGLLAGGQDERRQAAKAAAELAQRGEHVGRRAIGIVEHQKRRLLRIARARQRGERALRRLRSGGVLHRRSVAMGGGREGRREVGLARPVRAHDSDQRAGTVGRPPPARLQSSQLTLASDQRRRLGGVERARELGRGRLDVQCRVLPQDRLVQALEVGPGLDADLVDQRAAGVSVRVERLGLSPAPVERQHPLCVQALPHRIAPKPRFDLGENLLMSAGGQVGVDRQLGRRLSQALEPRDLGRSKRLVHQVREWLTAEQRERFARRVPGLLLRSSAPRPRPSARADVHRRIPGRSAARSRGRA